MTRLKRASRLAALFALIATLANVQSTRKCWRLAVSARALFSSRSSADDNRRLRNASSPLFGSEYLRQFSRFSDGEKTKKNAPCAAEKIAFPKLKRSSLVCRSLARPLARRNERRALTRPSPSFAADNSAFAVPRWRRAIACRTRNRKGGHKRQIIRFQICSSRFAMRNRHVARFSASTQFDDRRSSSASADAKFHRVHRIVRNQKRECKRRVSSRLDLPLPL